MKDANFFQLLLLLFAILDILNELHLIQFHDNFSFHSSVNFF